jgi:FAD/FMN-containing dehydrogenase
MISRREFIAGSAALAVASFSSGKLAPPPASRLVNDIHSQLNSTRVLSVHEPQSLQDVQSIIRTARKQKQAIAIAGGRHAMGGQQSATDALLIDIRKQTEYSSLTERVEFWKSKPVLSGRH